MNTRRSFLAGLAQLPLIGGSVALIGSPSGVAAPPSQADLFAYREWLDTEGRLLGRELFPEMGRDAFRYVPQNTAARDFHWPVPCTDWRKVPQPSTRARLVLATVGVPLARYEVRT